MAFLTQTWELPAFFQDPSVCYTNTHRLLLFTEHAPLLPSFTWCPLGGFGVTSMQHTRVTPELSFLYIFSSAACLVSCASPLTQTLHLTLRMYSLTNLVFTEGVRGCQSFPFTQGIFRGLLCAVLHYWRCCLARRKSEKVRLAIILLLEDNALWNRAIYALAPEKASWTFRAPHKGNNMSYLSGCVQEMDQFGSWYPCQPRWGLLVPVSKGIHLSRVLSRKKCKW